MEEIYVVFSTVETNEAAEHIAQHLVEEQLAACVNIIPNLTSVYKWKGTLERAAEQLLVIKTVKSRIQALKNRIAELHPYEVPEIIAFRIEDGHPPYLAWVEAETAGSDVG